MAHSPKTGVYWPFKTFLEGSGIILTEDADTLTIGTTGAGPGGGDMLKSQYAPSGVSGAVDHALSADTVTGSVNHANQADFVPWTGVTGTPSIFPTDWSIVANKPAVFPPAPHAPTHLPGGGDPIALAVVGVAGLLAPLSGNVTDYLNGTGGFGPLLSTDANNQAALGSDNRIYVPLGSGLPSGTILEFAGSTLPTGTGFLLCDGTPYSRTQFAALFAVIGVTYGAGNGSTTFNVPDKRGRSGIGAGQGAGLGNNYGLGAQYGEEGHVLSVAELASHAHGLPGHAHNVLAHAHTVPAHTHGYTLKNVAVAGQWAAGGTTPHGDSFAQTDVGPGAFNTTANPASTDTQYPAIAATGSSGAHNTVHPVLALNYIIKT